MPISFIHYIVYVYIEGSRPAKILLTKKEKSDDMMYYSPCGNAAETSKKSGITASKAKTGPPYISYMLISLFHYTVFSI
jgi:hypothetical protein